MKVLLKYYLVFYLLLFSSLFSDEEYMIYYGLNAGPNLVSFPILTDNSNIESFFTLDNSGFLSQNDVDQSIITLISEGEFGVQIDSNWNGSLESIYSDQGYWLIADQPVNFLLLGNQLNQNLYFFHQGANLISYPFNIEQSATDALNTFFTGDNYAIIGENQALLSINNTWWGSLDTFVPGKGYWFIVNSSTPFAYNTPQENFSSNINPDTHDEDEELPYNLSTLQSIFFVESIYISGQEIIGDYTVDLYCSDILVGQKNSFSAYTDVIAMGNDGFDHTQNYCEQNQNVVFKSPTLDYPFYLLKGNNEWLAYNFNINILSDTNFGDLNFNNIINITDVIIMLEHIIDSFEISNNHQLLLSDINQDQSINIADIIINIETILEN